MSFERLNFTCSWENPADFPTYEPNENQVRADLQRLHDECRDGLNRLVDALNDPDAASALPFQGQGLAADNVRDAVLETYEAVREASSGLIVDGAVTKEKLDEDLLERIYGGRTWVSMDQPTGSEDPDAGFPVGQIWPRPAFLVENRMGESWQTSGCAVTAAENGLRLTGAGAMASVSAVQTLTDLGLAGERVCVAMKTEALDGQLTSLVLYLDGTPHDLMAGGGVFETVLGQNGGLNLTIRAQWPAAALAVGTVALKDLALVNCQEIEEELEGCRPLSDWPALIEGLGSFETVRLPRRRYTQETPGRWVETDFEILPVARGGTGLSALAPGQLLYAGGDGLFHTLDAPQEDGAVLRFGQGKPCWTTQAQLVADTGALRLREGSYVGSESARTVTLPVTPKLLMIYGSDLSAPVVLGQNTGHEVRTLTSGGQSVYYTTGVDLSGKSLSVWMNATSLAMQNGATPHMCNKSGVTYRWTAVI